jgi:hypothetical protein
MIEPAVCFRLILTFDPNVNEEALPARLCHGRAGNKPGIKPWTLELFKALIPSSSLIDGLWFSNGLN